MTELSRKFYSSLIAGMAAGVSFLVVVSASVPGISGETGVPGVGYLHNILSNKLLVNSNYTTTNGQVKNSLMLDGLSASGYQRVITGSCPVGEWAIGVNPDNSIKCSSTGGTASYDCASLGGVNATGNNGCDWVFNSTGTFTWTVPPGVYSISAVAVGGGGGPACGGTACGGGGGALGWKNNIAVVPGSMLTIIVGDGGYNNGIAGHQAEEDGGISAIHTSTGVKLIEVTGGKQSAINNIGGSGGAIIVADGGGRGGKGGDYVSGWGGGGGAGGYNGAGGRGGTAGGSNAAAGNGGGGGGGGVSTSGGWSAGGGGGVGINGLGPSGNAGTSAVVPTGGRGGSSGGNGESGAGALPIVNHGNGGLYGGGAGATSGERSKGGIGAIRIIWGSGRFFPNNAQ